MTAGWLAAVAVVAALVCAAVLSALVPLLHRTGMLDRAGHRSLHEGTVPRGGGLAILLATMLAPFAVSTVSRPDSVAYVAVLLLPVLLLPVVGVAAVGLWDDRRPLPARTRLVLQVLAGFVGVAAMAPKDWLSTVTWLALAAVMVLWFVASVNLTNFMDGANGLVAGHAVVTCAWYAVASQTIQLWPVAVLMAALAGAAAGFLPFNLPRARVFLGDVGSYTLGAAYAVGAWFMVPVLPPLVVLAPLVPLLADSVSTLARRAYHGDPVTEPHRLHVYQRLVGAGWSHARMATVFAAFSATCALVTVPLLVRHLRGEPTGVLAAATAVALLGLAMGYLALPRRAGHQASWATARQRATR